MTTRTKSILAVSGTLLIGMVVGALIAFMFIRNRIQQFRELRQKGAFTEAIIQAAAPNAEQELKIRPLMEDFGQEMETMHQRHRQEFRGQLQTLQDSLANYLDAEQLKQVDRQLRKMRGGPPGSHKHRGHPPRSDHP